METIFQKIGYSLFTYDDDNKSITLFYINNIDGSLRWIWNAKNTKPLFLKFYNISSSKSKIYSLFIKLIFILKLQKLFFKQKTVSYQQNENSFFDISNEWALFTGTIGPNNKLILYADEHFYKISNTEKSQNLIENENNILRNLNSITRYYIQIPKGEIINNKIFKISDVSEKGRRWSKISYLHSWSLIEMERFCSEKTKISDWKLYQNLKNDFLHIDDKRIPKGILRKLNSILNEIDENEYIDLRFSHGDFTPWNSYISRENTLSVYDWELASYDNPKGFDFFHFIIQNGILVERKPWKSIYSEILDKNKIVFNFKNEELQKYLKYYFIINILQYLKIYAQQENWHIQIPWLLSTWNEALDSFLAVKYSMRELIIMDFFDLSYQEKYATIKFSELAPEKLSLESDIDLITNNKNFEKTKNYFKNHFLVEKIEVEKKSFMKTLKIITKSKQILSIDFIHRLKWKNLQILNQDEILSRSTMNMFGVKKISELDTARYIILFYKLNKADIPEKYENLTKTITQSQDDFDTLINNTNDKKVIEFLKKKSYNIRLNYIKNTFNYLIDSFSMKGFIITFSGVDGAGKSTVILNIAQMIEKRYRKPVKILRHRPAVLPILSAWTKGSEKAHQDVISSLPRQGKNYSFFSSLFRFGYYYTDYLLGQFVIYFKYVIRGYVVLYDRYYFDFIADSRRSNIALPRIITKTGYCFLLKPKFNFFLFADSETILKRKKELSCSTIEHLTNNYKNLFQNLRKNEKKPIYMSIKNEKLNDTLNRIMDTIISS